MGIPLPMIHKKTKNGVEPLNKRKNKQKQKKYRKLLRTIERKFKDKISRTEAKLLLHVMINHFDGFARQQQLIIEHMSLEFHWGNKRTARVLKTLADIGVLDRWKAESDNWTLFFLVQGFSDKCKERIKRAGRAIKQRISKCYFAIFSIARKAGGHNVEVFKIGIP